MSRPTERMYVCKARWTMSATPTSRHRPVAFMNSVSGSSFSLELRKQLCCAEDLPRTLTEIVSHVQGQGQGQDSAGLDPVAVRGRCMVQKSSDINKAADTRRPMQASRVVHECRERESTVTHATSTSTTRCADMHSQYMYSCTYCAAWVRTRTRRRRSALLCRHEVVDQLSDHVVRRSFAHKSAACMAGVVHRSRSSA